jgi:hypothetical protein
VKNTIFFTGLRKREAVGINSSLLVLGKVIAALVESHHHVPYLESKLTTMLRGAFGGNSRTSAIIACRSDDVNGDETLQSLRFGERCSMISNITKTAATSLTSAIEVIDESLTRVKEQLHSLGAFYTYTYIYVFFYLYTCIRILISSINCIFYVNMSRISFIHFCIQLVSLIFLYISII